MTASQKELEFIEQTMSEVRRNWNVALQDDFNPIMIALEMLQQSNPAHDVDSFMRLEGQLRRAMNIIVDNYYSGFNDAVSIFGGVVEGMSRCRDVAAQVAGELNGLGEQIAFKRADLPSLLAKQQECKDAIQASSQINKIEGRRREAEELLRRRSFVKAQMALSDCLRMVSGVDLEESDITAIQSDIAETKKLFTNTLSDECRKYIFLKGDDRRAAMFYFAAQRDQTLKERMLKFGLLCKHKASDFVNEKKELDALVSAMSEIGVLEETVRLLSQRLPLELHQLTRECLEDTLEVYRMGTPSGDIFTPFLIRNQMRQGDVVEFEGFAPHLDELSQKLFILHAVIFLSFKTIFADRIPETDQLWLKTRAALSKEANDFILSFTSVSREGMSMGNIGVSDLFRSSLPKGTFNYHFRITAPKEYCPSLIKTLNLPLTEKERAAAERMAALTSVDQYSTSWMRNSLDTGVSPNLQYLPLLAYPYCHLLNWAGLSDSSHFIDTQLINNYVPFLESHCIQSIAQAFSPQVVSRHEDVSDRRGLVLATEDNTRVYVSVPVIAFCRAFDDACAALYHLQIVQSEMETVLMSMCQLFGQKCQNRVTQLLTSNTDDGIMLMAGVFGKDKQLRTLLLQHPLLVSGQTGGREPNREQQLALEEIPILERLKADRSIRREELFKTTESVTKLLVFHQSLSMLPTLVKKKKGKVSGLTSFYKEKQDYFCVYLGVEPNEVYQLSADFAKSYHVFMSELQSTALDCLLAVRCELRAVCMYHLDLAYREGHYHVDSFESFSDGADQHFNRLANALIAFQEAVREASLEAPTSDFIFSGLPLFIEHLLIHNTRHIRGPLHIKDYGIRVLRANLGAIERALQAIFSGQDVRVRRARAYYDLLDMSTEQLMQVLTETKSACAFSMGELHTLLRLHYKDDKELSSQMVRLKYLFDTKP